MQIQIFNVHIANRIALVDNSTFVLYFQEENLNSTILCRRVEAGLDRFLEEKAGLFPTTREYQLMPALPCGRVITGDYPYPWIVEEVARVGADPWEPPSKGRVCPEGY